MSIGKNLLWSKKIHNTRNIKTIYNKTKPKFKSRSHNKTTQNKAPQNEHKKNA
jgi:hypothetical protein